MNIFPLQKFIIVVRNKRSDITAFILSGGKSSRIGINKAFLVIKEQPFILKLVELLDSIFSEVVISSNQPALYEFTKRKVINDIFPDKGPLSGIHSALKFSNTEKNFILSCDMPLISEEVINYLCDFKSNKKILLPRAEGRIQQLCGLYSKNTLPEVDILLNESSNSGTKLKGSIYELLDRVDSEIIDVDSQNSYHSNLFFNVNTPEDYKHIKEIIGDK